MREWDATVLASDVEHGIVLDCTATNLLPPDIEVVRIVDIVELDPWAAMPR